MRRHIYITDVYVEATRSGREQDPSVQHRGVNRTARVLPTTASRRAANMSHRSHSIAQMYGTAHSSVLSPQSLRVMASLLEQRCSSNDGLTIVSADAITRDEGCSSRGRYLCGASSQEETAGATSSEVPQTRRDDRDRVDRVHPVTWYIHSRITLVSARPRRSHRLPRAVRPFHATPHWRDLIRPFGRLGVCVWDGRLSRHRASAARRLRLMARSTSKRQRLPMPAGP